MKTLLHNLNKVVKTTGEDFHKVLYEGSSQEIEVFDGGLTVNLKVYIRDRNPPCTIHFNYLNKQKKIEQSQGGDLTVFISKIYKDPNSENN